MTTVCTLFVGSMQHNTIVKKKEMLLHNQLTMELTEDMCTGLP